MNKTVIIIILVVAVAAIIAIYYFNSKKKDKRNEELMNEIKQKAARANIIYDEKTGKVVLTEQPIEYVESSNENANDEEYEEESAEQEHIEVTDIKEAKPAVILKEGTHEYFKQKLEESVEQVDPNATSFVDEPSAEEAIKQDLKLQEREIKKIKTPEYITKQMKKKIAKLGYSDEEINKFKPKQAWNILVNKIKKQVDIIVENTTTNTNTLPV